MKWLSRIIKAGILVVIIIAAVIFSLPFLNNFQEQGEMVIPGLEESVTIQRDNKGMAYIRAQNLNDALMGQGFATAQDRLFQMQLTRLFAQGRISELAGEKAKPLDIRIRTIGLNRIARKQADLLDKETKGFFKSYVDGINAFIEKCPDDVHLEFKLAGIKPEKWNVSDSLSILYYMGFSTSANLNSEIVAQMLLETIGYDRAVQIMPVNINPDDSEDTGEIPIPPENTLSTAFANIKNLLAFSSARQLRVGSNNWAVSSKLAFNNKPILSGDPHLDARNLPGVWHPIGIITPEIRAVGANISGLPGIAIGRTNHIALAMTNNYGDMQDLYIETIDPDNPENYLEGKNSHPFKVINETLKIKDKDAAQGFKEEKIKIRLTRRGPVVSEIFSDLNTDKVITLRWAPVETMESGIGLTGILTAKSVFDLQKSLEHVPMMCLNWVFADTSGNIGHRASGKIPVRYNADGTFPHVVKNTSDNWHGWIEQDQMPHDVNPDKNWLGTCNHKTVKHDFPVYYSSYFAPSYRYRRLKQLMKPEHKKTVDDLMEFQRDTKNMMAEQIVPVMAKALLAHDDTQKMGEILLDWNFRDDPDLAAPAIFQTTYINFAKMVLKDELGEENAVIMLNNWYFWEERLQRMVLQGTSKWFDNVQTRDRTETLADLFHGAALKAKAMLALKLGKEPAKWSWGKIHTLELVNPIRRKGFGKKMLGSGPMPMGGSGETLYRGWYDYDAPFEVTHSASLRMVADLADRDKVVAVLPGGVSGRTFHPHQKDQVESFMNGDKMYWWFSDKAINDHEKSNLILKP